MECVVFSTSSSGSQNQRTPQPTLHSAHSVPNALHAARSASIDVPGSHIRPHALRHGYASSYGVQGQTPGEASRARQSSSGYESRSMELSWHAGEDDDHPQPGTPTSIWRSAAAAAAGASGGAGLSVSMGGALRDPPLATIRFSQPPTNPSTPAPGIAGSLPQQQPAAPSVALVSVHVLPLQMLHRPTFLEGVGAALGVKLCGTLEERLQRSFCELQSRRAQLAAKLHHLQLTPPSMQVCCLT